MRVHIADSCKSNKWKPYEAEWTSFVEQRLQQPIITGETFATYKSLDKDEKQIYKDCGGYIFGSLQKNSRAKADVISRNALLLDVDFAPLDVWQKVISTYPYEIVMHSTHSHESAAPRYRLIVPLNRECTPDEYECVARTFAYYLDINIFDKTTFQRNRLMYFPSRSQDGEWVFEWQRGQLINVDSFLAVYADWRDMTAWPYHKDERVHEGTGQKRQHPHEAAGIVGAFNRTYNIHDTISIFMSDLYTRSIGDRYTYVKGSSANGVIVYDDVWFYSYHATDPAEGRLLHSFELLTCHMFDNDAKKALAFISTIPEVRKTSIVSDFANLEDVTQEEINADWYGKLEIDKSGKITPTDRNVRLIFENDVNLSGVFKYNEFVNNVYLMKGTSWRKDIQEKGDTIRNVDYPCLRTYMGQKYEMTNRAMIDETMTTIAYENKFHPIRDYLSNLKWDGVPRIETALIDYFGVEDNIYTREVFVTTLIGAIMRAFSAGVKHDTVLVLVGPEGTAKSEFFKRLGGEWYSDTFDMSQGMGNKVFEQLQGKWLIEIAEIDKLSRVEVGQVKYFITKSADTYRPAFGHVVEDFLRQCIFVASTNELTFLKSETGNRRFYPALIRNGMFERGLWQSKKYVYTHMDKYEVDQMWAEAFEMMLTGRTNRLSREAVAIVDASMEDFEEQSTLTGELDNKLLTLVPENYDNMSLEDVMKWWAHPEMSVKGTRHLKYVSGVQIWVELLGRTRETYNKLQSLEILSAIRKSSFIDANDTERMYTRRYGRQRCYKIKPLQIENNESNN